MKRMHAVLLGAVAVAVGLAAPAQARNLKRIAKAPGNAIVLLDLDTIKAVRLDGRTLHEAVVSTVNLGDPLPGQQAGTDSQFQVDCATGAYRVVWTNVFDRDRKLINTERSMAPRPLAIKPPKSFERRVVDAICAQR